MTDTDDFLERNEAVIAVALDFAPDGEGVLYRYWEGTLRHSGHCFIFSNSYDSTYAYIQFLVSIARRTTPGVPDDHIKFKIINDNMHKGMVACEWRCDEQPQGFTLVHSLPTTY